MTFFRKTTDLIPKWSSSNRVVQNGRNDKSCIIASKLSKNKKTVILENFTFYKAQWVGQKGSEAIVAIFLVHFILQTMKKIYLFSKIFEPSLPFMKSNESTGSWLKSQHKLCFLTFYAKN